jgi:hypothetical protein
VSEQQEQQQDQEETPAVTAQAGLAAASSVTPAQEPGTEGNED